MKQLIFMIVVTLIGSAGALLIPFLGVWVYWFFAVLRPQYMWIWSHPLLQVIPWSLIVAIPTIFTGVMAIGSGPPGKSRISLVHWSVCAFGTWVMVSYLAGQNRDIGLAYIIDYLKYFLMFFVSAVIITKLGQAWSLYLMMGATLGYIAYEINMAYLQTGWIFVYHNGYGGMDNNGAGMFLGMGVPICYFAWEGIRSRWRWLFLALVPGLVHAVLMTYSRGAMLALVIVTPLFFVRTRQRRWLMFFSLGMALLLPFLAGKEIRKRFASIEQHELDESANSRKKAWAAAWKIAVANPVFGVGVRNSKLVAPQYGGDYGRAIHNQYLQIAADNGLVGLGLYLAVLGSVWLAMRRARRALGRRNDTTAERVRAIASGVEGALIVYSVGSLFLSCEAFESQYLIYLVAAALATVDIRPPQSASSLSAAGPVVRA